MTRRMFRQSSRSTVRNGLRTTLPCAFIASNSGDSVNRIRTKSPTPTRMALARNGIRHDQSLSSDALDQEDDVRQCDTERVPGLRDCGEPATVPPRRMFVRHQYGTAPLGAEGKSLDHADDHQQRGGQDSHLRVGRQQADQDGGDAHHQESTDEDRLAAVPVGQVPADRTADGSHEKSDAEGGEGEQGADHRIGLREEHMPEVEGGCGP